MSRSYFFILVFLLLVGAVVGWGSIRRPYGEAGSTEVLWPARPVTVAAGGRFRATSFNIHSGRGARGAENLARTADAVKDFDLVGLNEVRGLAVSRRRDQAEALGKQLGMTAVFGPSERRWLVTSFGNGLLSGFPILRWWTQPMSAGRRGSYRAVLFAQVAVGKVQIQVLVAHPEAGEMRDAQLREIRSMLGQITSPGLLLGDLNANSAHPELKKMATLPGVTNAMRMT